MATAFLVLNLSGAAKKEKTLLSTRRTRWFISQNPSYLLTPTESAKAQTSFCTQRHFWYRKQPKVGLSSSSVALGGHSSTGNVGCGVLWKRGCGVGVFRQWRIWTDNTNPELFFLKTIWLFSGSFNSQWIFHTEKRWDCTLRIFGDEVNKLSSL